MSTQQIIVEQLKKIELKNPIEYGFSNFNEDSLQLNAYIIGPIGTPYQEGIYKLLITFTPRYPLQAPTVQMLTKIYHPNIQATILYNQQPTSTAHIFNGTLLWDQRIGIEGIFFELIQLLKYPNVYGITTSDIYDQYSIDRNRFVGLPILIPLTSKQCDKPWIKTAQQWNVKYAKGDNIDLKDILYYKSFTVSDVTKQYNIIYKSMNNLFGTSLGKILAMIILSYFGVYQHEIKQCIDYDEHILKQYQTHFGIPNMQIFVKTLTGKAITVDMHPEDCIYLFKLRLREKEGIKVENQRVIYALRLLEDNKTFKYYGIKKESTLHVVIRPSKIL